MLSTKALTLCVVIFCVIAGVALLNKPVGKSVYILGRVAGTCSAPESKRKGIGTLECQVVFPDGNRQYFRSQVFYREGTKLQFVRRERRLFGYHYVEAFK